jgi:hypothetical protein
MKAPTKRTSGLIGLFGHTYVPDEEHLGKKVIQYQFQIIRRLPGDRWVVQLFSFMDGRPTQVTVYAEAFLLGEDVKLYALQEEWLYQHERQCDERRERRAA